MTREEFIQEAALRLIPVCIDVQTITDFVRELASVIFAEDEEKSDSKFDSNFYGELVDDIGRYQRIYRSAANKLADALMGKERYINLSSAKGISQCYRAVTLDDVKKALEDGKISGNVPQKKRVAVSYWEDDTCKITYRQQPVGNYEFDVKSLINWLEDNYIRKNDLSTPIGKCITELKRKSSKEK